MLLWSLRTGQFYGREEEVRRWATDQANDPVAKLVKVAIDNVAPLDGSAPNTAYTSETMLGDLTSHLAAAIAIDLPLLEAEGESQHSTPLGRALLAELLRAKATR